MIETLRFTLDAFLDRSPGDLIGAVMIALVLALAMTGLYALMRWRKPTGEPLTGLIALMLVANVASMALAAGYLTKGWKAEGNASGGTKATTTAWWPPPGGFKPGVPGHTDSPGGPPVSLGPGPFGGPAQIVQVFAVADLDKDGRLTPDEVARFVQMADANGKGSVNMHVFYSAIRECLSAPPGPAGPPPPTNPDEPR
jgi:hypothetical protein